MGTNDSKRPPTRPRGRPRDDARLRAMRDCYAVALVDSRSIAPRHLADLYDGRGEFGFRPRDWTAEQQIDMACRLLREGPESVPEDFADWHDMGVAVTRTGAPMAVYAYAAGLFNGLLRLAQQEGRRLDEKPTTPGALQRALHRASRASR